MPGFRMFAAIFLAGLVLSTADQPTSAAEKSRAGREDEKREDAAVRKAREAVGDAEQEVRQSQQALQRSQAAFREAEARRAKAGIELQKAVDRLERDHAESVSIAAARAALNTARARFKEAAQPVLETVRSQAAYKAAEAERAEALALLAPEAESDRDDASRRASAAAATMRNTERSATAANPRLAPLDAEVTEAESRFRAAQSRFEEAVENAPELRAARKAFDAAKAAETKAEAALVRDNRDLFTARAMLARAQQSLVAKRLADLEDSNKPPKKDRDK